MVKRGKKNGIKVCKFERKTYTLTAMAHPIRPNYKQTYFFSHSLEELILLDHPVRFIRAFVDALDLEGLEFCEECEILSELAFEVGAVWILSSDMELSGA